jgi:hypothetical protein
VRKDAPMKSVLDIRGKRLTGEYPAQLSNWYNIFGFLAGAGMKWEDVKIVAVPGVNEGVDALMQGRADVSMSAIDAAKVKEADAAIGVKHISLDCSAQGEKRLRAAVPGYYPHWIKRGGATAIVEDTCVNAYDIYLTSGKSANDPQKHLGQHRETAAAPSKFQRLDAPASRGRRSDHSLSPERRAVLQGAHCLDGGHGRSAA